jgi:phosphoribosylformylglycinamidine (FGAM) synthase-like enzyme
MKPTVPLIHMNGNSQASLLDQYANARQAVAEAMSAMKQIDFHPRDYYPLGSDAWNAAKREHGDCYENLRKSYDYLCAVEIGIYTQ